MNSEIPTEYASGDILVPLEYKKGYTKFLNCKIDLRNRVFIPRIETEFWVKKALNEIQNSKIKNLLILDMFAGSGCIGIAILKNVKNSFVDFVDINKKAIEQIKINLMSNKIFPKRYKIYKSDLFKKIEGKKYDVIFANPPYVAKERLKETERSVLKYEPKRAILAGKKGLLYIKKFLKEAKKFLKPGGTIYFEFDPQQKTDIVNILKKESYKNSRPVPNRRFWCGVKFFKDQFKKYRWTKISLK